MLLAAAVPAWASTYYVSVIGSPSSIACTNTSYTFASGATLKWNLMSTASIVDVTNLVNGTAISTASQTFPIAAGQYDLSGGGGQAVPSTPFPYTVTIVVQPRDPDTDGVSVSFTCDVGGGTNFQVTNLPPPAPLLQASPSPVSFPATNVGTTSATIAVTITNNGTANATGVAFANNNATEFMVSANTCGATLAIGASCTLNVAFAPSAGGPRSGNLVVSRSGGSGVTIPMTGTGVASLAFSSSVNFADQAVGTTSAPRNVTVTNTGSTPVTVASITSSVPSEFGVSSANCTTINAGANCTISLTFTPAAAGARSATITIASNGVGSPQTISVSGNGTVIATPGQLSLASTVAFGAQAVGTTSAVNNMTVTNTGGAAVTISSITSSAPSEFGVSSSGCTTVNAGAGCTITLTFTPAAVGARTATITVVSSGVGSPQTINVSGTGTAIAPPGQLSLPGAVTFGLQTVGTTSAANVVTVTNTGGTAVTVTSVTSNAPSEFGVASSSCTTVNAAATCTIGLTFTPATAGARTGTITVVSSGVGSPQTISVSGTGSAATGDGQLAITGSLNFGSVMVGTTSAASAVSVNNIGGTAVAVTSVSSSNPSEFTITGSDCGTVNAGAGCSFSVTFSPGATGARAATVTVVSNGVGSPQVVSASGTGVNTPATIELIEYRHAEWDHYFVTGIADEITKLDNGTFVGWARTGHKFNAYPLNTAGSATVCRFFSTSFAPRSSHFYTPFADECAKVKTNPDWSFEGDVFAIPVPALDGSCPSGTVPVYRLYNNGQGAAPNHRYTIVLAVRAQMIAAGWVPEGYGDIGVIMCAPT